MYKMKNALNEIYCRMNFAEENISELEKIILEINQEEKELKTK